MIGVLLDAAFMFPDQSGMVIEGVYVDTSSSPIQRLCRWLPRRSVGPEPSHTAYCEPAHGLIQVVSNTIQHEPRDDDTWMLLLPKTASVTAFI